MSPSADVLKYSGRPFSVIYPLYTFEGESSQPSTTSLRFVQALWWLFGVIIVSTYAANLVAFLAVEIYKPPFRYLSEVLEQEEFQFGTLGGSMWFNMFKVMYFNVFQWRLVQLLSFSFVIIGNK